MKFRKTLTALVLSLAMVGAFTLISNAANGLQEIKAYLNSGITLKLDGEAQVLTDASGVHTYPITYNGTTYLPIRSIGSLLGVDVGWDQATQSVLLGKQPSGVDLIDTYKHYAADSTFNGTGRQFQTGEEKPIDISGINCSHWIQISRGKYNGDESTAVGISFNLAGKHDTLTFSYYAEADMLLRVLGDNGAVLFEKAVTGSQVAQTATVPLFKTTQLTFQISNVPYDNRSPKAYIFDAYLDAEK